MGTTYEIDQVDKYNRLRGVTTVHPLVSVIDFSKIDVPIPAPPQPDIERLYFGCYALYLKHGARCEMHYGRRKYDFQEGTLVFLAPGQSVTITAEQRTTRPDKGFALLFHPDLLANTPLATSIHDYKYFSYELSEGLHVSEKERAIVVDCLEKISTESSENTDAHSRRLIVSTIQLLLDYCERFFGRQFHTRFRENNDVLIRFERLLQEYFEGGTPLEQGLPTVQYFANQLHYSANYLGDLIHEQTGKSPRELIQTKLIEIAKTRLHLPGMTINEVASSLGFKHPQHFSRFFKQRVGVSPSKLNNPV